MADFTYDILFKSILNAVGLRTLDKEKYKVSQIGFLRSIDLTDKNLATTNQELERVCNSLCQWLSAYVPNGDLVNSYALFLNYLEETSIVNSTRLVHKSIHNERIELEAQIHRAIQQKKDALNGSTIHKRTKPLKGNEELIPKTNLSNLLEKLTKNEAVTSMSTVTRSKDLISLEQAKSEVSFITGARKIDGSNSYNMISTENGPLDKMYSPAYRIIDFDTEFSKWQENKTNQKFSHHLKINNDVKSSSEKLAIHLIDYTVTKNKSISNSKKIEHIDVSAKFSGLGNFNVEPVNWFHTKFFNNKKYSLREGAPDFFGENGSLYSLPVSLLLGYNIKIMIRLKSEIYSHVTKIVASKNQSTKKIISIGSERFCISGKEKNAHLTENTTEQSIIIEPFSSNLPSLLGVISRKNRI